MINHTRYHYALETASFVAPKAVVQDISQLLAVNPMDDCEPPPSSLTSKCRTSEMSGPNCVCSM